jgi:hypothetical protein
MALSMYSIISSYSTSQSPLSVAEKRLGETRLAARAASEVLSTFPAGMWVAPLASTQDGAQAPGTVALAIGMPSEGAVTVNALRDQLRDN